MKLKTLKPKRREPVILLMGEHGIGKTTFGSHAPDPVFILTEDGASGLDVNIVSPGDSDSTVVKTWSEFNAALDAVLTQDHEFKTLVIDTANSAITLLAKHVCDSKYGGQWAATKGRDSFMSFQQGWATCAEELRPVLQKLSEINNRRGMLIIMTSHTGLRSIKNPRLGEYQRIEGAMNKNVWQPLADFADLVMLAEYEMLIMKGKRIANPNSNTRILRCGGSVADDTKMRAGYEVPEIQEFSFEHFKTGLIEAHNQTAADVYALWPSLPKDRQTKALRWLDVKKIEDIEALPLNRIQLLLGQIKTIISAAAKADAKTEGNEE